MDALSILYKKVPKAFIYQVRNVKYAQDVKGIHYRFVNTVEEIQSAIINKSEGTLHICIILQAI